MKKICAVLLFILLIACTSKAAELYDTAKFEELQNNRDHAIKLYEEIVVKYPNSAEAGDAGRRLAELKGHAPDNLLKK